MEAGPETVCFPLTLPLRIGLWVACGFLGVWLAFWWEKRPMRRAAGILLQERIAKDEAELQQQRMERDQPGIIRAMHAARDTLKDLPPREDRP